MVPFVDTPIRLMRDRTRPQTIESGWLWNLPPRLSQSPTHDLPSCTRVQYESSWPRAKRWIWSLNRSAVKSWLHVVPRQRLLAFVVVPFDPDGPALSPCLYALWSVRSLFQMSQKHI